MLAKRLIVVLMVLMLLVGCGSNPTRDDGGPSPQGAPASGAAPDDGTSGDTASPDTSHSGGGNFGNFNGDPRILLGVIVVVVVVISAVAIYHLAAETLDSIRKHTHPADPQAAEDGIYRDPHGLFSVAVPGEYPAQDPDGIEVRQTAAKGQEQVFFITAQDDDPVYGVSVQPLASPDDAAMPLPAFASKVYPPPVSGDPAAPQISPPSLEQDITLDGKPALFREYSSGPGPDGRHPVYYLLYFVRNGQRSAVLSITWFRDCPGCSNGPEVAVRNMDPHLKQFVESFHLADTAPAN